MERVSYALALSLSTETERSKGKAKLSKPFERVYLILPFSFNLFRFEAETNPFAFLLTSHTFSSISIQNSQVQILHDDHQGPPRSSTVLKSGSDKLTCQKKS